MPLAHIVGESQRGESPKAIRWHVIDALVLKWAASDAGEWENRVVEIPSP